MQPLDQDWGAPMLLKTQCKVEFNKHIFYPIKVKLADHWTFRQNIQNTNNINYTYLSHNIKVTFDDLYSRKHHPKVLYIFLLFIQNVFLA